MIKTLYNLNNWLPLVKDLVANWAPYYQPSANIFPCIFLIWCRVFRKSISHIKLKVIRTGERECILFLKKVKPTERKIIVDIIIKDESTQIL